MDIVKINISVFFLGEFFPNGDLYYHAKKWCSFNFVV
jgi:hypothetical protein